MKKRNAEAEAAYKKQVEDYKPNEQLMIKLLEEYNAKRQPIDAKVAEKAAADKANAVA